MDSKNKKITFDLKELKPLIMNDILKIYTDNE